MLGIGLFREIAEYRSAIEKVDSLLGIELNEYIKEREASSRFRHVEKVLVSSDDGWKRVYVIGLGSVKEMTRTIYRKTMGDAFQKIPIAGVKKPAIFLDSLVPGGWKGEECAELIGEAMMLSTFVLPSFRTTNEKELSVWTSHDHGGVHTALEKGKPSLTELATLTNREVTALGSWMTGEMKMMMSFTKTYNKSENEWENLFSSSPTMKTIKRK